MRPWFRESVKAGDRRWSEIYPFFTTMALGISASQPVYDTAGHLKGVLATDLMLQQLVDFLRSLKIGRSGQAFIIERSGYIVATSTSETPVLSTKDGKDVERLQASKSDVPLIRLTVQHLRDQFGDLHNIAQAQELKVKIGQNQQFLQVTPYQDKRGLDWLIVVAIPEDDFIAQINANTRTTILLCLTALIVTIAIGILTANWISRPIWRLSEASREIAQQAQQFDLSDVDLEQQVKIGNIVELAVLAESFNKMTHQLQESFTALEATNDELEERVEQRTAALRLSEEKFAIAFRASPDIITITALENGKIIEVNDSFLRATGYRRTEVMGRTTIELNSWVNLEDRDRMTHLLQTQGFVRNQEYDFRIKSGEIRIGLFSAEIINIGGQACLLSIINDITERKQMEQALRSEQEKSERLLLNILPERVAQQLKQSQGHLREDAIAEFFEEVTILFADIVGFAPLASRMPPIELVNLLNQVFSSFDQLARHHGLEKIKTIGDAYMVTGGLPVPRADHAEAIAEMALDMQYAISKFQTDRGVPFQIRIGINTGSVVAGVIGINRFTYDLWGDTVNVASRMESHGEAGRIQVTAATYERLRDRFVLEERGIISIKGKEEKMKTYWLKARKCQEMAS
jgi:PAS domain S-box-containing protein